MINTRRPKKIIEGIPYKVSIDDYRGAPCMRCSDDIKQHENAIAIMNGTSFFYYHRKCFKQHTKELYCKHCKKWANNINELEINHRSCRLKATFPGSYHENGNLVSFNVQSIADANGYSKPIETKSGLTFQYDKRYKEIWIECKMQVGNTQSSWAWLIRKNEWDNLIRQINKQDTTNGTIRSINQG